MVLSVITASGRPKSAFRSKCTCSGSAALGPARRPVVRTEPDRDHRRRRDRPAGELVGHVVVPEQRVAVLDRGAATSRCSRARRGTPPLRRTAPAPISAATSAARVDDRSAASCHHPFARSRRDPARPSTPASSSSASVSVAVAVGQRDRPGRGRSMPASTGPTCAKRPAVGWRGLDDDVPRPANCGVVRRPRPPSSTGATQVSAPASRVDPLVAVPGGEGGREGGPDRRPGPRRRAGSAATRSQPSAGTGWRRTWARWPRPPATGRRRPGRCRNRRSGR